MASTMAKRQTAPSNHRVNTTNAAPQPVRRSARLAMLVAMRKPFRFADLPPELRNRVYTYALHDELKNNELRELTSHYRHWERTMAPAGISYTARALSQVSRATRNESLGMYYSENTFRVSLGDVHHARDRVNKLASLKRWASTHGQLAAPSLRILSVRERSLFGSPQRTLTIYTTNATRPVSLDPSSGFKLSPYIQENDLNALVLAILRPDGRLELQAEQVEMLVTALYLIAGLFDELEDEQRAEFLAKLATKVGQQGVLEAGG